MSQGIHPGHLKAVIAGLNTPKIKYLLNNRLRLPNCNHFRCMMHDNPEIFSAMTKEKKKISEFF